MTVYQVRVFCAITSIILCFGLFQLMRLNNDEISVNQNFRYEQNHKKLSTTSNNYHMIEFKDVIVKIRYLHYPAKINDYCNQKTTNVKTMLIFVQSTPSNYKQRAVIRETWANRTNSKSLQDSRARVLFMIGDGEAYSAEIQREISKYDDIILYDLEDTYRNLVYKTAASLLFSKNCFSSFTMKIDEDVAVHIDKLADKTLAHVSPDEATLLCKTLPLERAHRDPQSAWYISKYRLAEDALPTYCSGPSYIMTRKALELIIEAAPKFRLISVEDIFFTGVIAKSAGVKLVEQRPTYLQTPHKECSPNIISNHNVKTPEEMRSTWKLLQSRC